MSEGNQNPTVSLDWLQFAILDRELCKLGADPNADGPRKYTLRSLRLKILKDLLPQTSAPFVQDQITEDINKLEVMLQIPEDQRHKG